MKSSPINSDSGDDQQVTGFEGRGYPDLRQHLDEVSAEVTALGYGLAELAALVRRLSEAINRAVGE